MCGRIAATPGGGELESTPHALSKITWRRLSFNRSIVGQSLLVVRVLGAGGLWAGQSVRVVSGQPGNRSSSRASRGCPAGRYLAMWQDPALLMATV